MQYAYTVYASPSYDRFSTVSFSTVSFSKAYSHVILQAKWESKRRTSAWVEQRDFCWSGGRILGCIQRQDRWRWCGRASSCAFPEPAYPVAYVSFAAIHLLRIYFVFAHTSTSASLHSLTKCNLRTESAGYISLLLAETNTLAELE